MVPEKSLRYLEADSEETKEVHLWGSHIKCFIPSSYEVDTSFLKDLKVYSPTESKIIDDFSMIYKKTDNASKAACSSKDQNKVSIVFILTHHSFSNKYNNYYLLVWKKLVGEAIK